MRTRAESLTIHAPAKLNLFLEVLGRRSDGFHEVETSMVAVGWYDTLTFETGTSTDDPSESPSPTESHFTEEVTEDVRLTCVHAAANASHGRRFSTGVDTIPAGADNLVVRAARLLQDRAGVRRGVRIRLVKRIPAEAGLGGGSSDAAATLAGLNRLWRLGLSRGELVELAAELGSDVPFFLGPTPAAVCRGRGEIIEPIRLQRALHFVVVKPPGGCSTAEIFARLQLPERPISVARHLDALRGHRLADVARSLHNRLQTPAEQASKDVRRMASISAKLPVLGHSMTGSGSAWFGLCASARQARAVAARLRAARVGRVAACRSQG